jgi:hypothetical protein
MILIGSRALALRAPVVLSRQPKDFDFVATAREFEDWCAEHKPDRIEHLKPGKVATFLGETICEFEIGSSWLTKLVEEDPNTIETSLGLVPSVDMLFTLKTSHRYLKNSPHFWKNALDWHRLRAVGAKVRPGWQAFLKQREKETYTYAHPKLNQNKKGFFAEDQGVIYTYDHDSIHEAVALGEQPAYRCFQKDEAEVACSKDKFFACSREVQINSVVEESAVLAIERSLVPHPGALTPEKAWRFALSKVCTSIASGWWRQFAYENLFDVLRAYPADYFDRFKTGLKNGVVQPHKVAA